MEWVIVFLLAVIAFLCFAKNKRASNGFPYIKQGAIFTPVERSFYYVLSQASEGDAVIFGKTCVSDVLRTIKGLNVSDKQKAFNKISARYFDFVLCRPDDLTVVAVVELDGSSHKSKLGKLGKLPDRFLDSACDAAGLTLHRIKAKKSYNVSEVRRALFPRSGKDTSAYNVSVSATPAPSTPVHIGANKVCPRCSSELVTRVAKKGRYKGSECLVCRAFPGGCRYYVKKDLH